MAANDDFDAGWGDDPFSGDIDFDMDFDSPNKKGFLRSFATGFLNGIVNKTVGDTDARIDTLKMVLPRTYTGAFGTLALLNRRKREVLDEIKGGTFESVKDLQYLAGRAAAKLRKAGPNRIADGFDTFSKNDFSDWEQRDYNRGNDSPSLEDTSEDDVKAVLSEADANSMLEREATLSVGEEVTSMMAQVGGRTVGQLSSMNMATSRTNMLLEQIIDHQRRVQARTDAMKLNLMTRTYLTNAKFYKFAEAANHRIIEELKAIATNSRMSDYEKTTHSQAMRRSIRESVFNTAKTRLGGISSFINDRFGKTARDEGMQGLGDLTGTLRMAAEMAEGADLNLGDMVGNAAAGLFISNLPRLVKTNKAQSYVRKFKTQFPKLGKWADDAYARITDLGNVATYALGNAEGSVNTLRRHYKGNFNLAEVDSYEEYIDTLPEGQVPLSKTEWTILHNARRLSNNAINGLMDNMSESQGTRFNLARRTLDDGGEQQLWTRRSDRTLNEELPRWLSEIHLSIEKFRTGNDNLRAMSYDYVKGGLISHQQKVASSLNQVLDRRQFSLQADMSRRLAENIDSTGSMSEAAKQALAYRLARDTDAEMGFSPYNYLKGENDGLSPEVAEEIRNIMMREFGLTQEHIKEFFDEADPTKMVKSLNYLPTEKGREKAANIFQSASTLGQFVPDISNRLDVLKSSGYYEALKESGIIKSQDGIDTVNQETIWKTLQDYIADPKRVTAQPVPASAPEPSRPFGTRRTPAPVVETPAVTPDAEPVDKTVKVEGLDQLFTRLDSLVASNTGLGAQPQQYATADLRPVTDSLDVIKERLENLVVLAGTRNETLNNILLRQPKEVAQASEAQNNEVEKEKRGLMDRLKQTNFRDLFNNGVDKLLDNQPLVLGGLLGGLAGLAVYNPKGAALIAGGAAAATAYGRLRGLSMARKPKPSEDLYEEGSETPILEANKLARGDYLDMATGVIINAWEGITGSLRDISNGTVIAGRRLAGKLFTADNKEVFIAGLNKVRDTLMKAFRWFDPINRLTGMKNKLTGRFYQMDVYKEGEDSPVLSGKRFASGDYWKKTEDGEVTQLNGWNEIDGPVYDREGNVLITQEEYDAGLRTSMGVSVNKLQRASKTAARFGLDLVGKLKDKVNPMAKGALDKTKGAFKADYTPITSSVDRIYTLLLKRWGMQEEDEVGPPVETLAPQPEVVKPVEEPSQTPPAIEDVPVPRKPSLDVKDKIQRAMEAVGDKLSNKSPKNRLNSNKDRAAQKERKKDETVKDSIIHIAQNFGFGEKKGEEKKKNSGIFGMLLTGIGAISKGMWGLTKFFTRTLFGGFKTLFNFASIGSKVLPVVGTGIAAIAKGLFTLLKTRSITEAGGTILDTVRGNKRNQGPRVSRTPRGRMMTGGKILGAGMAVGLAADALAATGVVDEGSTTEAVLNGVGTAASVAGAAQLAWGTAGALGVNTAAVAGAAGTAATTALGWGSASFAAAAPLLFNPITLGVLGAAALGYGIYKFVTRGKGKQLELRMVQYGVADAESDLAKKLLKAEEMLTPFVVIGNGRASFSQNAPIQDVMKLFMSDPADQKELGEIFTWFNGRVKPVMLTYMACLDVVKFKSLKEYDEAQNQDVYKVAKQASDGLNGVVPYPYGITGKVDADTSLLGERATKIRVMNLLEELKKYIDRKTDSSDLAGVDTLTYRNVEGLQREKAAIERKLETPSAFGEGTDRFKGMDAARNRLSKIDDEIKRLNSSYKVGEVVEQVYVKDLLPENKAMDLLTAIRVACYGNDQDLVWRVEAVLKLERYSEQFFRVTGDNVEFTGQIGDIFSVFKDSFRVDKSDADDWCLWYRDRFLPVMTNYVRGCNNYRRGRPGVVWKTLSATARYEIAKQLVETRTKIEGSSLEYPVWNVRVAPFKDSVSPAKPDSVNRMLKLLGEVSTTAKLKDPEGEAGRTNATTWANEVGPHKVGGGFTEQAANVQTVDKARNRREVALGGQFGTAGGGSGNSYSQGGVYQTPANKYGFTPLKGDSDTSHLDMSGVQKQDGNDKGVSVPKKLAQQIMIREMLKAGFTDPRAIAEMLALTDYESGGYSRTTENMKYSSPAQLAKMFREVRDTNQARQLIEQGEVAIANTVYGGGKGASIGNTQPGDGWRYRGRGFVQLTGRANYAKIGQQLGIDLENKPELASNDPNVMAQVAVQFFKNSKMLQSITSTGNFGEAAKGLNGGNELPGMPQRYQLYLQYLDQLQKGTLGADGSTGEEPAPNATGQTASGMYGKPAANDPSTASQGTPAMGAPSGGGGGGYSTPTPMMGSPNMPSLINSPSGGQVGGNGGPLVQSGATGVGGLRLKSGEAVAGGRHHPGLGALAKIIQQRVAGFKEFTALNDAYHVNKGSKGAHPKGLALDFTLTNGMAGSDAAAAQVNEVLRQAGLTPAEFMVINEYRKSTALGTGGHVHAHFKSEAAAQKFLEATGGSQANGEDTQSGEGAVSPEETTPNRAQPAVPPMGGEDESGDEGQEAATSNAPATGARQSAAPSAPASPTPAAPAAQAPAPVQAPPKAPVAPSAPVPAAADNNAAMAAALTQLAEAMTTSGGAQAALLRQAVEQLTKLNQKGAPAAPSVKLN